MQQDEEDEKWAASRADRRFQAALNRRRELLELVRSCQSLPESDRVYRIFDGLGFVYLMQKRKIFRREDGRRVALPVREYKICRTKRPPHLGSHELSKERLYSLTRYMTPIPFALEKRLHSYYDDFRAKREGERQNGERENESGERFRLSDQAV
jgi:hypothetical protein